ncbi:hypothetical protein [Christiangramia sp. SM2212]|uniref:Phytase-like domain-containing protein n=1 Tax=Christiangramia sediminicola TaxID=3073267 RepID=A0ABU1ETY6_9FLAO|nr:hypothetical protein [Christiangramia sp. SM2212]MDR5591623.1 hypothetical protein [Christiangramia sp. SM2212]
MIKTRFYLLGLIAVTLFSCNNDDDLNSDVETSEVAHLYATTHSGQVRRYDINDGVITNYSVSATDIEGFYYSSEDDNFSIVSRSSNQIESYSGIRDLGSGGVQNPEIGLVSTSEFESPRDLAVNGQFYVVSDNTDLDGDETTPEGRLFIYVKTETGFVLRNVLITKFKVWGLEFVNSDLYAAVDETNKIAVYRNFIENNTGNRIITADKIVGFQGLIRTHGLDFDNGIMVLSDIGEAESATDGGLHIIQDFEEKFSNATNGGFISIDDQFRIAGANTLLGNPVNVVYDASYNVIFVAEALNNGGRVLAFNDATSISGNIAPDLKYDLAGASSVFYFTE